MGKLLIGISALAVTLSAYAGKQDKISLSQIRPMPNLEYYLPYNNSEFYSKALSSVKKTAREPAEATTDVAKEPTSWPQDFITLRNEVLNIGKGKDENGAVVDYIALVNKYSNQSTYNGLSNEAKLAAIQLRVLKPFQSFTFRARDYIKTSPALKSMIVSVLYSQFAGIQAAFNTTQGNANQWEIVFRYITQPSDGMGEKINSDVELYNFYVGLVTELNPVLNDMARLATSNTEIWWDNSLFMAFANFQFQKDRYVKFGKSELNAFYAGAALAMSTLLSTTAYSFDGLRSAVTEIGYLWGVGIASNVIEAGNNILDPSKIFEKIRKAPDDVNAFMQLGGDGMSSHTRTLVVQRKKNLFKLLNSQNMKDAYLYLATSARAGKIAYEAARGIKSGDNLFNAQIAAGFNSTFGWSTINLESLVGGFDVVAETKQDIACPSAEELGKNAYAGSASNGVYSAVVKSEIIRMNVKAFYCFPPTHLNELYAQDWDLDKKVKEWNKEKYRNYRFGMATKWNYEPYRKIFPDLKPVKEGDRYTTEVPKYSRILMQTWGGAAFILPIGAVIL
jgi:hypothetical protein